MRRITTECVEEKEGLCDNRGRREGCIRKGMGMGTKKVRKRDKCVRERRRNFMGKVRAVCRKGGKFVRKREKCVRERGSFIGRVRTVCRRGRSLL